MVTCLLSAQKACFTGTRTRCNLCCEGAHQHATHQHSSRLRLPRPRRQPRRAARRRASRAARGRAHPLGRHPRRYRRLRGQGLLARDQARRRQGGLAAQRRLLQLAERGDPDLAEGDDTRERRVAAQRHAQHGRAAPHPAAQDHLPRFHAARHRPARGGARAARAEHRQDRGGRGHRRLRRAGVAASCRCRPSPDCSVYRRTTATSCSAGPTR